MERGLSGSDSSAVGLAFWNTVKQSDNPAMLQAYLERYPTSAFTASAEIRVAELKAQESSNPGQ